VVQILSLEGDHVTDCVAFGEAPQRWAEWDPAVACERVLEAEPQEG
jgi:hypothetical protein